MVKTILISRDSKSKIRVVEISYEWNDTLHAYVIERSSGLHGGKMTSQPPLTIARGKVKRTVTEQTELEYNSLIKKYKDKGYKDIREFGFSSLSEFDPDKVFPKEVTNQAGVVKPMLCKVYDPNDKKNEGKTWYISRKLDGVRSIIYYKDGEVRTSSRGGQDYDIAATYIRLDPFINQLFEANPNIRLDGEIYRHGWMLNKISGLCRLETLDDDHKELQFHCYDIVDENKTFNERLNILNDIKSKCSSDSKLVIVDHYKLNNLSEIDTYHNDFVSNGYEGAVIRDADSKYKPGSRGRDWQKIKLFTDDEYEIIGLVEGLREEDMCFLMKTKEGYEFKAKPIGTREDKQKYREDISNMIGKFATVKHFGMTNTEQPVPNLPVWKALRIEKDI